MGQGVEKDNYEWRVTGLGVCRKLLASCDLRLAGVGCFERFFGTWPLDHSATDF